MHGAVKKNEYNTQVMNPITVAFFGISGSGKGTQASLLIDLLKERDPEARRSSRGNGQFLAQVCKQDTLFRKKVNEILLSGGLVPSFMAIHMLTQYFNDEVKGDEHFIFDGTCRRIEQSVAVDEISRFYGRTDLHIVAA
jgi:adenylate kinase family enzyme